MKDTASQDEERIKRLRSIGLMCAAILSFSVLDATAKYILNTTDIPASEVIWFRFFWHALLSLLIFSPLALPRLIKTKKPVHQWFRALLMLGATAFNFTALRYLQLDQTITIFFLTPLIVAALAGPLLGEWVGWRRLLAILTGFIGVLFVVRPGFGGIHWAIFLSFGAMLSYALYNISTRHVAAYDPPEVTQFYSPLAGLILVAPFALVQWVWPQDLMTWFLLLSTGITGGLGHWLLILAHRGAPAPVLAPFVYTGLIYMIILGYMLFEDTPDPWTLAGGAIVIASGLYLFYRERTRKVPAHNQL